MKHSIIILGAGFWGKHWIESVLRTEQLELASVVEPDNEVLSDTAKQCKLSDKVCFSNLDRALAQTNADIVAVVTIPPLHKDLIETALKAGKHVICEKPLADTWENGLEIRKIVDSHPNRKFMVSQTRRFTDQVESVRKAVREGIVGEANTIFFDHRVNYTRKNWKLNLNCPVLDDMAIHHFDALRYITGQEPISVIAKAWSVPWGDFTGKPSVNVLMTFTGNIHINYFGSWAATGQTTGFDGVIKVIGSKGTLDLVDSETLLFYPFDKTTSESTGAEKLPIVRLSHHEIDAVIGKFLNALNNSIEPECNIADNIKSFGLICAAIESCNRDRPINIQEMLEKGRSKEDNL